MNPARAQPTDPAFRVVRGDQGTSIVLQGYWNLRGLAQAPDLRVRLSSPDGPSQDCRWDLSEVAALDSAGALLLWQVWGHALPKQIKLSEEQTRQFQRWSEHAQDTAPAVPRRQRWLPRGQATLAHFADHLLTWIALLGQFFLDVAYLMRHPSEVPWREISATIHETGGRALGITALVGFLIGVVVSYLSSLQLQMLGAQIYIVNILGMSVIRELGPLLAAILVAGRSGSAMTARIGVMRVTQELDALAAMGISLTQRLILPKIIALVIALPLLIVWTDIMGLLGGAMAARIELDISYHQFFLKLPNAVPVANFAIGLGKGSVFGLFIALVACHFGLRIKPDTESLGNETTHSVVAAITLVILVDAVFAILFRGVGLP